MLNVPAYSISADAIKSELERVDGDLKKFEISSVLQMDTVDLPELGKNDVHLKVLAVSAEHNVDHASTADTINIAEARGGKMIPGNSATCEIIAVGSDVSKFSVGDIVITHCNGRPDKFGYPERIWGYDEKNSIGWYAKESIVADWQIIHAPLDCGLNFWEIAALPLRAPTAYHMWRRALGMYRVKVPYERQSRLNVLGFGGGVSELFLQLAKAEGHNTFFCSGSKARREAMEVEHKAVGIDQLEYNRFEDPNDIRKFVRKSYRLTKGNQMHIVCDMLRGPIFEAGLAVAARQGVNVSAGWQLTQEVEYNSSMMSIKQVTLDHSHYETIDGCNAATELYGKVFKPVLHSEIYSWDDLPRAHQEMHENTQTGIPIIRIADELPAKVEKILP